MAKGRKALPTKIIDLRGGRSHTHRPPRSNEPKPPEKAPRCPNWLDPVAKKEWRRSVKLLAEIGLLAELDMPTLAGYCNAFSQWARANEQVNQDGLVYIKKDGTPGLSPYLRIAREAYDMMMRAACLCGMSPSSRATMKVGTREEKVVDPMEDFLNAKKEG